MTTAKFPSDAWVKKLAQTLNENQEYKKAAAKWEGTFLIHVKAEDGLLDNDVFLWIDPWHGEIRSAKQIKDENEETVNYGMVGKYSNWKQVISGELDSTKAMLKGKLKVIGKMSYLLRMKKASDALMKILKNMDTEFVA